ncbi:MAG: EF-hand domain-containing protein [Verrucomicrobiota bacterium]
MNMTTKKLTALLTASALTLCALPSAFAGSHGDKHFKLLDADGDGKITRAEHAAGAKQLFAKCDANGDGIVTAAEMDAMAATSGEKPGRKELSSAQKIAVIDHNGDGQLTAVEHAKGSETMFGKTDTDGDGVLTKSECDAAMKMMEKGANTQ